MPPYSTADQKSRTNDPHSIHGSSRGVSSTNSRCFAPRACIPLLSSAFLASIHHFPRMAHATIAVLNLGPGDYPEIDFCWLFPLAFHESISCIPGIAMVASFFSLERTVAHPL